MSNDQLNELLTYPVVSRYEVIADYPENKFDVGDIIELRLGPDERFCKGDPYAYTKDGALGESYFKRWPQFYKKL